MTTVDSTVREFSISFYPPAPFKAVFFCVALVVLLTAVAWLGMRLYLHLFGARAEGKVTESVLKMSSVRGNALSTSRFVYTRSLKIDFTGPDGVVRTLKGRHYSNNDDQRSPNIPNVGGTVPVLYRRASPAFAMYFDPAWHYLVPIASLVIALLLSYAATRICYEDLRVMNTLSMADSTRDNFQEYHNLIIENNLKINDAPEDAAAYERRGDAQFATVQFGDAIEDYSEALRLRPEVRDLVLKRAKAEWLDGRDFDALRDWLKYRRL